MEPAERATRTRALRQLCAGYVDASDRAERETRVPGATMQEVTVGVLRRSSRAGARRRRARRRVNIAGAAAEVDQQVGELARALGTAAEIRATRRWGRAGRSRPAGLARAPAASRRARAIQVRTDAGASGRAAASAR